MKKILFKILYTILLFNLSALFVIAYRYIFWGIEKNSGQVFWLIMVTISSFLIIFFVEIIDHT